MDIPLFDGHCDAILRLYTDRSPTGALKKNDNHVDLERGLRYSKYAQFFALFGVPEMFPGKDGFEELYRRFRAELSPCRTAAEAAAAAERGQCAAFLSIEGAELIDCDPLRLEQAYEKGVRSICLSWNRATRLCGSSAEDGGRGLSSEGREFVMLANRLGMIVDVSHLSDAGVRDIAGMGIPFIASHSNSRAVYPHPRNLDDDMFRAVRDSGGTAGLNLFADFLGEGRVTVEDVIRHAEHFLDLGGEKTLAIGGDLDGCDRLPEGIEGIQDMTKLYAAFTDRGYGKELLDDIFYNNLMRVVERVCTI
ncbi:MAG: membrane dipeptidase [Oscillospiraceae bacterium]|nr:membrane dipeptidase [Oscillospiraceae bacterium]